MPTSLKRILVPTDGSDAAAAGMHYAIALAKRQGASVHGLHVVDVKLLEGPFLRDISASLGTAPYVNYQGHVALILEERGKAALEAFHQACDAAGVSCETSLVTGIVTRTILEKGDLADLIVMGRGGEHTQWLDGLVGSTTEAVVRRAVRPVLVTGVETPGYKLILVAFDGSRHAHSALHVAARYSAEWDIRLHVLSAGESSRAQAASAEARSYLSNHPSAVEYVVKEEDPSEAITRYAKDCGASLLAMGAYGHTKMRELVVGSTTAYALNHAPCPVLLVR